MSSTLPASTTASDGWPFDEMLEARIGQGTRAPDGIDLVRFLHEAQRHELIVNRMQLDAWSRFGQRRPLGMGDDGGLHAERDDVVTR